MLARLKHHRQNCPKGTCSTSKEGFHAQALTGTWDVKVTLRNCDTGESLGTLRAVNTFSPSGVLFETGARVASNPIGAGQGSWRHLTGNSYSSVLRSFRCNHDGSVAETQKVTRRLELSEDGKGFTGTSLVQVFDANNGLILAQCSTETAERLE